MIRIAPISSKIASEVKNTFRLSGTREPNKLKTPRAKAISVAVGIAQPCIATGSFGFKSTYISAGTTIPPIAPNPGRIILRRSESSPSKNSRLSSRPTNRKNTAIKPSLTHINKGFASARAPTCTTTGVSINKL